MLMVLLAIFILFVQIQYRRRLVVMQQTQKRAARTLDDLLAAAFAEEQNSGFLKLQPARPPCGPRNPAHLVPGPIRRRMPELAPCLQDQEERIQYPKLHTSR